jgi:hypothetical protein
MRVSDTFPSKHLAAADLHEQDLTLTIASVAEQGFDDGMKLVLSFRETKKTLVANKTNSRTIVSLYGDDCDKWNGHRITLFPTYVDFQGKTVPAIRVRPKSSRPWPTRRVVPMTQGEVDADAEGDNPF